MNAELSPAEALLVLSLLMQQKLANPDYQLTHAEEVGRWAIRNDSRRNARNQSHPAYNRSQEVGTALRQAASSIPTMDALQLSSLILNTLGIEQ